ncbi:hypothetical protein ZWY2020_046988 [Hordeum vulgare]|nr:hypothetical protein ZWY2020_046988 [Hordeum vulgare]
MVPGDTLAGDTVLCKRYGVVPAADAEPAAHPIEVEAFDTAAVTGRAAASVEEGIEMLQLYSKEVSAASSTSSSPALPPL